MIDAGSINHAEKLKFGPTFQNSLYDVTFSPSVEISFQSFGANSEVLKEKRQKERKREREKERERERKREREARARRREEGSDGRAWARETRFRGLGSHAS